MRVASLVTGGSVHGYHISVYDATYLELAVRLQMPLATLGKALHTAARAAGIESLVSN